MKTIKSGLKKAFIIVTGSIIITILLVILLASPVTKYLIGKYDEKYTGRQIKTGMLYVNPFTGHVYIRNLKIFESKSSDALQQEDSVFFSAKELSAKFAVTKLFRKTIEITELTLNQPKGIIIQQKTLLNFSDIIRKYTPEKHGTGPPRVHFNILSLKIKNGEFYYREKVIPVNYFIKEVNIESTGRRWNVDTTRLNYSFMSGTGNGNVKGIFTINYKNLDYRIAASIQELDLNFLEQYLRDLINFGYFHASLDADIKATGNFRDAQDLNLRGMLEMNDFHLGKNRDDDYASFEKVLLKIDELSPKNHKYLFDSLSIHHPYIRYELYDKSDNVEKMFGKTGATIPSDQSEHSRRNLLFIIADWVKALAKNFFQSDYKMNKLAISKAYLRFNDYSGTEKFSVATNALSVVADSVNNNRKWVKVYAKSDIQPYGKITVALSISPDVSGDFDMVYKLQGLPVSIFNPYLITNNNYPLDRGTIDLNGTWNVRHGNIQSENHLVIIDPHILRQSKNKDTKSVTSPVIMFLIRKQGNIIDYKIPITGNLKNPKFHLHDVIYHAIGKFLTNPATFTFRLLEKKAKIQVENSLSLQWEMRQASLLPEQEKFVNKLAEFLVKNPDASISVSPLQYSEKEREYISFFEARKKYFLYSENRKDHFLNKNDSLKVDQMSVKDSLFVIYLNKQVHDTMLFTLEEKCNKLIGETYITSKFERLNNERTNAFLMHFKKNGLENRVKILKVENTIPYDGFSFFKIAYTGDLPQSLIRIYRKMNELTKDSPGKRFEKEEEKSRDPRPVRKEN